MGEFELNKKMIEYFMERTNNHIQKVQININTIISNTMNHENPLLEQLKFRRDHHDESKFSYDEFLPYVQLTWNKKYKIKTNEELIKTAIIHHYYNNRHHPEHFNFISIDLMNEIDLIEMVADWQAMSQEFDNSLKEFAKRNIGTRWLFNEKQQEIIWNLINIF